jgi:small redox-active disulfide protein 2
MEIKVLGTGCCGNCNTTAALIEKTAQARGVKIDLSKVEDMKEIAKFGVMSTPAVVIDGKVVHSGSVPTSERIEQWLAAAH